MTVIRRLAALPTPLILSALLLLTLALPAAGDPDERVRTSRKGAKTLPLPKGDDVFHFVIYGDRTGGPASGIQILAQAVRETNLLDPDLVMTVGDLVQGYNAAAPWIAQMREYQGVMSELAMPWYPVAGNHDVYWRGSPPPPGQHESRYEEHFGPLWYWFPHKNAAFVVLYTDEGDAQTNKKGWNRASVNQMSERQLTWLEQTLEETKAYEHVFVFLHHPRWRADYYKGTNWDEVHRRLVHASNVSAVFAGHMHRQRYGGKRDGIEYFTLAATGGGMPFDAPGTGHLHHLDVVSVRKDTFSVATIPIGAVIDPREMTPAHLQEIDGLRGLVPQPLGPVFQIECDGGCAGRVTLEVENPATQEIEVTLAVRGGDDGWIIRPDHIHHRIAVGATGRFTFGYRRSPGTMKKMRAPRITIQPTWVGDTMRVEIPERATTAGIRLATLPEDFFDTPNAAAVLDGKRNVVRIAPDQLAVPDGPFTIEAWFDAESLEGRRALLAKTEHSEFGLFVSDGTPTFSVFAGAAYVTAAGPKGTLQTGRWTHIAGVFDGECARLYVDGRLVGRGEGGGTRRRNALPLFVGADPNGKGYPTSFFHGRVDEVRVSAGVRYAADFEPERRHAPDARTLLLLHLDRGVGLFVPDEAPDAHHALAPNGIRYEAVEPK